LANALAGVTTDIYEHLLYLADKGYIRVESLDENPLSCLEYTVVLTAKGIDLLDGSIRDDPGIVI
jgi:hypothetical protein